MEASDTRLIRYSAPGKYDEAPIGTECIVINSGEAPKMLYRQMSQDETNPLWECIEDNFVD